MAQTVKPAAQARFDQVDYDPRHDTDIRMHDQKLAYFEALLRERETELVLEQKAIREQLSEHDERFDSDIQEQASYPVRDATVTARLPQVNTELSQVRAALTVISADWNKDPADREYGICAQTDDDIPMDRLVAVPHTRLSVEAQDATDRNRLLANAR